MVGGYVIENFGNLGSISVNNDAPVWPTNISLSRYNDLIDLNIPILIRGKFGVDGGPTYDVSSFAAVIRYDNNAVIGFSIGSSTFTLFASDYGVFLRLEV